MVRVEPGITDAFAFTVARDDDSLAQAFTLLHDAYVGYGLQDPAPDGMRVTPHQLLPTTTTTLVARDGERVIATVAVVQRTDARLPLEEAFDLQPLVEAGRRVVEISALAVAPEWRRRTGVLFGLIRHPYEFCEFGIEATDIVMCCHPRHFGFYESVLLFDYLGCRDSYGLVCGNPMVAGRLDLSGAPERFREAYGGMPEDRDLHGFFRAPGRRPADEVVGVGWHGVAHAMTAAQFRRFALERGSLDGADATRLRVLADLYRGTEMEALVPAPGGGMRRVGA